MTTKTIVSDKGNTFIVPVMCEDEVHDILYSSGYGWCLTCGEEVDSVEPDASKYHCEVCNKKTIYGYEMLLAMGLLQITSN